MLPRLLYIGDLPVEDTHHSSVQLFRLLEHYPADRLGIIETRVRTSDPRRRLPGVSYRAMTVGRPRFLRNGWRGPYSMWMCDSAPLQSGAMVAAAREMNAEAILTLGSGVGWVTAAEASRRLRVPLHFIAHDDWPKVSGLDAMFRPALQRRYGAVYRAARSRLCVSPYMVDEFTQRYGVGGTWLAPIRTSGAPSFEASTPRTLSSSDEMTIGYAGGSGAHVMPGLMALARATRQCGVRVVLYGPFNEAQRATLLSASSAFEFRGHVERVVDMMAGLRDADVLFVPMAFDPDARANMTVSFPSKLAEYTALGLPILVHAPAYSSAARWAAASGAAMVVEQASEASLASAIEALRKDRDLCFQLAARAAEHSHAFDYRAGKAIFEAALQ